MSPEILDFMGAEARDNIDASEIVEGIVLFNTQTAADSFAGMHDEHKKQRLELYSVEPEQTVATMTENGGVIILIDGEDPPNPEYFKANLLKIAYDLPETDERL